MQADEINQMIEEVIKKFNHDQSLGGTTPDDQCALILFSNEIKRSRDLNNISAGTEYKYHTVLRNFKEVAVKLYGEEYLPFKLFRDIKEIEKLKVEIRLSRRNGKPKKNKAVRSYMSQFASVVHRWNSISGTQNPINILPFTTDIVVEKPQKVLVPEINQIHELVEYTPKGHRGGKSEMIAKSVFLFQYYCSGIRFQDAILATNKSYKSGSLYVRIRKTDNYSKFEVHYPMIQSLKQLYPDLFKEVNECVTLSSLKLPVKTLANLAQIGYQNPIPTWNLEDLNKIEQMVQQNDDTFSVEMGEKIFEIKNKLQDFITKRFFEKLFGWLLFCEW